MITKEQAHDIVLKAINETYTVPDDTLIILDDATQEIDLGWVFSYDSKRFVKTDDFDYALAGNGPVVVLRENGDVYRLGTAVELDLALVQL
ncbi:MAG: YrhB family protein [Chloroflexales bacterium]|nr:YrhB family protein [Chloroflexales bacterium]